MIAGSLLQPPREGGLARGVWIMSKPVVLITGALTGIGRATAVAFATEGARLVVSGRHEEAGQALAAELRGLPAQAALIRPDAPPTPPAPRPPPQPPPRFNPPTPPPHNP